MDSHLCAGACDSVTSRSLIPNLIEIGQEMCKIRIEINLLPLERNDFAMH
jgi:hypothetical protein